MSLFPHPFERDKPLSAYSTFGIGGPALLFSEVHAIEEMQAWIHYCHVHNLRYLVIGKGSNCLFDDEGFDGLVLLNKITFCDFNWPIIHVGAGYSFSLLGVQSARNEWSGLEFASGIPGSVGGAIYMNAGANGAEVKNTLIEVSFIDKTGELQKISREAIYFDYRFSSFQQKPWTIVSAKFLLTPSQEARKKQLAIVGYRTQTQPYSEKSAGCVFRNPSGGSAGALIQQCGLKGVSIGGAEVSALHGNFIINKKNAKARDVLELASYVKKRVKDQAGVELDMEIRYIPYRLQEFA